MNSRLPSTGTPGSSLSVARGEDDTPTQISPMPAKEIEVGKSSTWEKVNRKDKRVTKRLEAERQELEKRLIALEESQSKVDPVQDRTSRRLTKKQPVGNSSISSSANAERPKSSSGFSSIFRRSRRSSASSDLESQYDEFSRLQTDTNPPSLPLTLPERFGTAITRELQSKHGTALNLSAANKAGRPPAGHLLHATPKSDDLRENWKMAEAWKAQHGQERSWSLSKRLNGRSVAGNARKSEISTNPASEELDRELFSAALKHDRKSLPAVDHSLDRMSRNDRTVRAASMPTSQSLAQTYPPCPAKIAVPPEIAAPEPSDSTPTSSVARVYTPLQIAQANATGSLGRKNRVDPFPRTYKSSPLALSPADADDLVQKESGNPKPLELHEPNQLTPLPSPIPVQSPTDVGAKSRIPIASSNGPTQTASRFKEDFNDTTSQSDTPRIPIKSERRSQESWRVPTASTDTLRDIPHSPFQVGVRSPFHTGNTSPGARSHRTSRDMSDSNRSQRSPQRASRGSHDHPRGPGVFRPGHSRTSSHNSDYDGHSNYDTADEDAPESPSFPREPQTLEPKPPTISNPPPIAQPAPTSKPTPTLQPAPTLKPTPVQAKPNPTPNIEPPTTQPMQPELPDSRRPMSILKRRSQKSKHRQLTKIFVICCRCKYWHDLPSEVYARLAYPDRLDEPKLSSRKGNDRKSNSRMSMQFPAAHAVQGMDLRPAPLLPRKVSCCWCGHNMSRSCCEGWTAVVEMRERHH
ncbi:unnamed protein product [Penicillium salamii]|uniref:Uncharacterized protein n=1 Tax=Penicillium salamii TaxID=1612424 RepID=A0A9W4JZI3_9EURO|nr:unnamed protein product [Penicillium salamii]CAG8073464.1 unnamed protein product [Penicillium salamii]CAG8228349.1 unnamed protein product [Penicillium salamii]CAG8248109.1 unnamed protein product [Penicillium salamii]CAG8305744.1 unnamed protein product [Penicillium salamii]